MSGSEQTLWIEQPEVREGPVARVVLLAAVEGTYSYSIPEPLTDDVEPGRRVLVPFGRNRNPSPAFVISVGRESWTNALKPIAEVLDDRPLLNPQLMELGEWMSQYYCCPQGRALSAMVPEAVRSQSGFVTIRIAKLRDPLPDAKLSVKRKAVIERLRDHADGLPFADLADIASSAVLSGMAKTELIDIITERKPAAAPNFDQPGDEPTFTLNKTQQDAIDRIVTCADEKRFRTLVLFGISGSGKTEVYIHAIRKMLAQGKQAILLVPEIALTTQMVRRLTSRFTDVAVIHSGLTGAKRSLTWAAIERGEKKVIIGTRSAVFAPCPNLGLIVVDEEQESSYKNLQSPRFHTRDVAVKRAQLAAIPIVLGSATPSLETWHNCTRLKHFERIVLPSRVAGLPMPDVKFVDMQQEASDRKGIHLVSEVMGRAIYETAHAGKQSVLLLNRRGYANYLVCARCRTVMVCPHCRANVVFHQTTGKAMCHHCNRKMLVPDYCGNASCGGKLIRFGMGTQRVEEEMRNKFPDLRIARADSDTMKRIVDYEDTVRQIEAGEIDVLIGTQMIAKGLDFPNVSFVGVINADTSMAVPDFRAAERTFQLITQVAGRAGRADAGGRVIVQTMNGVSSALRHAAEHDYEAFANDELALRERIGWPPFTRLTRFVVAHRMQSEAQARVHQIATDVRTWLSNNKIAADVLGPQTAPMPRLRGQYRYDFMLRAVNAGVMMKALERLRNEKVLPLNSKDIMIDVDPASLS